MTATQEADMSRRSMRLVLGGYYNHSSEDEESSSVSYRESPVRVFSKRKTAGRKGASSRSSSRANSVASTCSVSSSKASTLDPPVNAQGYNGFSSLVHRKTCQEAPREAPTLTPAPSLSPSTNSLSFTSSQTSQVQRSSAAVDSSGYSSSEAIHYKGYSGHSSSGGQRVTANHSTGPSKRWVFTSTSLTPPFKPAAVVKAILAALLLILLIFACCRLASLVWSVPTESKTLNQPIIASTPPPAFTPPSKAMDKTSVFDAVLVAKIKNILSEEMLEKQAHQQEYVTEIVERLQMELRDVRSDVRDVKMRLDSVDPSYWERSLSKQEAGFTKQMDELSDHHTRIRQRVTALEDQSSNLEQQVYSLQKRPPPAPVANTAITDLTPELREAMAKWLRENVPQNEPRVTNEAARDSPLADRMPNFALESQGASLVSTRCSETYRSRSACVSFLGIPLWYPSESPRTVIQGHPLQAGRCWPFQGAQGTLVIALSHPAYVTHVSLEHLPVFRAPSGRIDSAPKAFSVYGLSTETEEGTLLGTFTYDQNGDPVQTFQMPNPAGTVYEYVELRVLSNWGHVEYTCVYSFRVHGHMAPSA
ncbi:SUN domain-containing protein 2 isoform X2 [Esox lucius]|uniref:SUN domain-containing protein 2 isoform X2 n=1 Tax=Esox lucius TaxID=8010 RepID=UPI001476E761|nr:SUN domain-containing protein 2 isoform X2 [Esox lucius]